MTDEELKAIEAQVRERDAEAAVRPGDRDLLFDDAAIAEHVPALLAEVRQLQGRIQKATDYVRASPLPHPGRLLFLLGFEGEIKT